MQKFPLFFLDRYLIQILNKIYKCREDVCQKRGRNTWREKGPEGVHESSTFFLSLVIFL